MPEAGGDATLHQVFSTPNSSGSVVGEVDDRLDSFSGFIRLLLHDARNIWVRAAGRVVAFATTGEALSRLCWVWDIRTLALSAGFRS